MKAPFPWFGGKRRVAPEVWAAFGDVDNYVRYEIRKGGTVLDLSTGLEWESAASVQAERKV